MSIPKSTESSFPVYRYRIKRDIYIDKPGNRVFPPNEERVIVTIDEVVELDGKEDTRRTLDIAFPRKEFLKKYEEARAGCYRDLEGMFRGRLFIPNGGWVPSEPNDPGWVTNYNNYFNIPVLLMMDGLKERGKVRLDYHLGKLEDWKGPL